MIMSKKVSTKVNKVKRQKPINNVKQGKTAYHANNNSYKNKKYVIVNDERLDAAKEKATPYSRNKAAKGTNTSYDVERIALAGKDAGLSKGRINRRIKQYLRNQRAGVNAAKETAVTLGSEAAGTYASQQAAGVASNVYDKKNSQDKNSETNSKIESINDQLKKLEETMYGSTSDTQTQTKSTTDKNGINNYESGLGGS